MEPLGVRAGALRGAARVLGTAHLAKELRPVLEGAGDPTVRAVAARFGPALERCDVRGSISW